MSQQARKLRKLVAQPETTLCVGVWDAFSARVAGKFFIRGKLRADFTSGEVSVGDKLLELMPSTYSLLYQLMTNEGKIPSNQTFLEKMWRPEHKTDIEYLRSCITRLKNELEKEPGTPTMIFDEGGMGYKFIGG